MEFDAARGVMLSITQVIARLKVSPKQLDDMIKRGHFPTHDTIKNGKALWNERTVTRWLAKQR